MKYRRFIAAGLAALVLAGGLWITGASSQTEPTVKDRLARLECAVFEENCPEPTPTPDPTPTPTEEPSPEPCNGIDVPPGAFAPTIEGAPAGSTFCLRPGSEVTYTPQQVVNVNGGKLIGTGGLQWNDPECAEVVVATCQKIGVESLSRIDLSGVPIGSTSGASLTQVTLLQNTETFDAPYSTLGGCRTAVGGVTGTPLEIRGNYLHGNAWGYAQSSPDWLVVNNLIVHNGWGIESTGAACQGFMNGQAKTIRQGVFLKNQYGEAKISHIWWDVGNENCGGEAAFNKFEGGGNTAAIIYEVCWGGVEIHDNYYPSGFGGARAVTISNSAGLDADHKVHVYNERIPALFGVDEITIQYGQRAIPECEPRPASGCNGIVPEHVLVELNTSLDGVQTSEWEYETDSVRRVNWPPNGCRIEDPDDVWIQSVICQENSS